MVLQVGAGEGIERGERLVEEQNLRRRNMVDLPQPEPPMVTRISPGATASERPSSARTPLG